MQVNDPSKEPLGAHGPNQFHPTITVDSTDVIHVFWFDNRNDWSLSNQTSPLYHLYGAASRNNGTWFGGAISTFDQRYSLCPLDTRNFVPAPFRPDTLAPSGGTPPWHLGNYIGGPSSTIITDDITDMTVVPFWVHAPATVSQCLPTMESDVFATPTRPHSLIVSPNTISLSQPNPTLNFALIAGSANAGRTYNLWATPFGTDPGLNLTIGATPICPENLICPCLAQPPICPVPEREVVLPLNIVIPGSYNIANGNLGVSGGPNPGGAQFAWPVPPGTTPGLYRIAYLLTAPPNPIPPQLPQLVGYDFASNVVEVLITP